MLGGAATSCVGTFLQTILILCVFKKRLDNLFSIPELESLVVPHVFSWVWSPAAGLSGGLLTGINTDIFYIISSRLHRFCISTILRNKSDTFFWELLNNYDPSDHALFGAFLAELSVCLQASNLFILVGGDFNILRPPSDKNNLNFSWASSARFNAILDTAALREIPELGLVSPGLIVSQTRLGAC